MPASRAMPIFTTLPPPRRTMAKATPISSTTATSKNSGSAQTKPVSAMAQLARLTPNLPSRVWATRSRAPVTSITLPNMAPSATTTATKPRVPPIPFWMVAAMSAGFMPAASPATMETRMSETTACRRAFITRKSSSTMEPAAVMIRERSDIVVHSLFQVQCRHPADPSADHIFMIYLDLWPGLKLDCPGDYECAQSVADFTILVVTGNMLPVTC